MHTYHHPRRIPLNTRTLVPGLAFAVLAGTKLLPWDLDGGLVVLLALLALGASLVVAAQERIARAERGGSGSGDGGTFPGADRRPQAKPATPHVDGGCLPVSKSIIKPSRNPAEESETYVA